tara:strand:+ start:199 stop:570 length:372 start_codon:yes stop_codon:yes gene_type:complete
VLRLIPSLLVAVVLEHLVLVQSVVIQHITKVKMEVQPLLEFLQNLLVVVAEDPTIHKEMVVQVVLVVVVLTVVLVVLELLGKEMLAELHPHPKQVVVEEEKVVPVVALAVIMLVLVVMDITLQ